ncbi:MAG: LemA family protein [Methanomassiliicoccales archaeon]|nr:LemA family protein [Methanomassiliicoccales archaeon]
MNQSSGLSTLKIVAIVAVIVLIVVAFGSILTYNSIVSKEQDVKKSWGNIEAAYQMRVDKIPAVLSAVNATMTFERSLLENITNLRTQWLNEVGKDVAANVNTTEQLDSKINALLLAINENYPDLKSVQVVDEFIAIVDETENVILAQRVFYNDAVASYNSAVKGFPGNIFADMFDFEEAPYYERGQ